MIVGPGLSWNTLLCFSESVQIKPTTKSKLCGRIQKKKKKSKAENQRLREQDPAFVYITHSENGTQFAHI